MLPIVHSWERWGLMNGNVCRGFLLWCVWLKDLLQVWISGPLHLCYGRGSMCWVPCVFVIPGLSGVKTLCACGENYCNQIATFKKWSEEGSRNNCKGVTIHQTLCQEALQIALSIWAVCMIILLNHPLHPTRWSNSILSFPIYIYIYISVVLKKF